MTLHEMLPETFQQVGPDRRVFGRSATSRFPGSGQVDVRRTGDRLWRVFAGTTVSDCGRHTATVDERRPW